MSFLMQAAQVGQLNRLRRLEESKIPIGEVSHGLTVTQATQVYFNSRLISFTLLNDGPNDLFVEVNKTGPIQQRSPIANGESYTCDFTYPEILFLTLSVNQGESAAVRIRGKAGRSPEVD